MKFAPTADAVFAALGQLSDPPSRVIPVALTTYRTLYREFFLLSQYLICADVKDCGQAASRQRQSSPECGRAKVSRLGTEKLSRNNRNEVRVPMAYGLFHAVLNPRDR